MGFAKWIGGSIGWAFGGPIGALVGFGIGSLFDKANTAELRQEQETQYRRYQRNKDKSSFRRNTGSGDFGISLLVLSAAVMKANGVAKKSELNYVKAFLIKQFDEETTKDLLIALRDLLNKEIPLKEVCVQIQQFMPHAYRLQLLHYLFGIAKADGHVDSNEVAVIQTIANYLNISVVDFESLKAMFYKDTNSAYKVLEIEKTASNEELKKAYRKMAMKYHPDKVSQLGEEFQKAAKEKFQEVQAAYEQIKKERGI